MSKRLSQNLWDRYQDLRDRLPSRSCDVGMAPRKLHLGRMFAQAKACGSLCCIAAIVGVTGGCHLMVNPFTDELAGQQAVTTPSAEGAWAVEATPAMPTRRHARLEVATKNGTVTHGPLYFENGLGKFDSDDGRFAWTSRDYLQLFHWRGRFLFDAAVLPIRAICTLPCVVMESDGQADRAFWGLKGDGDSLR